MSRLEDLLLERHSGGQDQGTEPLASPLQIGQLCCVGFLRGSRLCATWLRSMLSRLKLSGALFTVLARRGEAQANISQTL
jgi:hypothetical protein